MSPHCSRTGKARQGKVSATSRLPSRSTAVSNRIGRADVATGLGVPGRLIDRQMIEPNKFFPRHLDGEAAAHHESRWVSGGAYGSRARSSVLHTIERPPSSSARNP